VREFEGESLMAKDKQTEVSTDDGSWWNESSGDSSVDAIAAVVAESAKADDLEEKSKVEKSKVAPDSTTEKEKASETEKPKLRFETLEDYETAYREKQSAADKAIARAKELEGQLTSQETLAELMSQLTDVLGDVDNPDIQLAIQKVKEAAGQTVLNRERVDHKLASELEKHLQAYNERIARLEQGLSAKSEEVKAAEAKIQAAQLESDYPYAPTIKADAEKLLAQHASGELDVDQLVLKLADVGYKAGLAGKAKETVVAERTGSDAGGIPGKIDDSGKKLSDAEILTQGIIEELNSRPSYT